MTIYTISFGRSKSIIFDPIKYQKPQILLNVSITLMDQLSNMESNNYHKYLWIEIIIMHFCFNTLSYVFGFTPNQQIMKQNKFWNWGEVS